MLVGKLKPCVAAQVLLKPKLMISGVARGRTSKETFIFRICVYHHPRLAQLQPFLHPVL